MLGKIRKKTSESTKVELLVFSPSNQDSAAITIRKKGNPIAYLQGT